MNMTTEQINNMSLEDAALRYWGNNILVNRRAVKMDARSWSGPQYAERQRARRENLRIEKAIGAEQLCGALSQVAGKEVKPEHLTQ